MDEIGFNFGNVKEQLIGAITEQLLDWDWEKRNSAAENLKYRTARIREGVLDLLIEKLSDKDWEIRDSAAGALGHIAEKSMDVSIAIPELVKTLKDKIGQVRDDSSRALENTVPECTKKELLQFLRKIRGSAEAKQLSKKIYEKWMKKENEKTGELQKPKMKRPEKGPEKRKLRKTVN
ncbi:HEAT repeat domain-containing protein [Candidatus Micrarchaeota archaeon]|nr:HEAT repeat domain-containing protein [Candidatus Micrarchaeota archaeon]